MKKYTFISCLAIVLASLFLFAGCAGKRAPVPTDVEKPGNIRTIEPYNENQKEPATTAPRDYETPAKSEPEPDTTNDIGVAPTNEGYEAWKKSQGYTDIQKKTGNPGHSNSGNPSPDSNTEPDSAPSKYNAQYSEYRSAPWMTRLGQVEDALQAQGIETLWIGGFPAGATELPENGIKMLADCANWKILRIVGNASSAGSLEMNKQLSLKRTVKAAHFLEKKGADLSKAEFVGQGPTNKYGQKHSHNRCVTIIYRIK